ncbi:MAG: tyrosine-type recombinase/integrase [Solirubrobacteraceae bacterium]
MSTRLPAPSIAVRAYGGAPFYEARWRYRGQQVKRRIGFAWLERDATTGAWTARRGRVPEGYYDERRAHVDAAQLVREHAAEVDASGERDGEPSPRVTFAELANAYLAWLGKGAKNPRKLTRAKPATLRDHGYVLSPDGRVLSMLGDRIAAEITTGEIEDVLEAIAASGVAPRTVNKHRAVISAVYGYGVKSPKLPITTNPARLAEKRREPGRGVLLYYSAAEIEGLARALAAGLHRDSKRLVASDEVRRQRRVDDEQDAELVRVAGYTGLRLGELLVLRWHDIDFAGHVLSVARALSAGVETSTKSGKVRRVPLTDQAAGALDRLSKRQHYVGPDDLVFVNALGRYIDPWSLRARFKRARDAAGLRALRLHDLRHSYGSLLAAAGVPLIEIKSVMGHSAITTTEIYLHAKPATDQAAAFSRAFAIDTAAELTAAG